MYMYHSSLVDYKQRVNFFCNRSQREIFSRSTESGEKKEKASSKGCLGEGELD